MKIVSWNCRGKFREKKDILKMQDADIYVVQECENPKNYREQFSDFYHTFLWYGEKDSKGLAIFVKPEINIKQNDWKTYCLRHFISARINDAFDLLAVWASPPYIEEYYIYQSINIDNYNSSTIILGDFNSNAIWDKSHGKRNHSAVVSELKKVGLVSAYHYVMKEKEGEESKNTFYMYGHKNKQYHIDYCFVNPDHISDFSILDSNEWLKYSDHLPIQIITK